MARPQSIGFHVPASTANLGPGYGVLAIALDLPLSITAVARTDGEVHIERRDDPSAKEDPRHDPVLRGLRAAAELLDVSLSKGLDVVVEGTIPRGTGLGTISAGFAAGIGIAMRLSRQKDWSMHRLLDCTFAEDLSRYRSGHWCHLSQICFIAASACARAFSGVSAPVAARANMLLSTQVLNVSSMAALA